MQAVLNLVLLIILGVAVGLHWGLLPGVAACSAVWLLMPYNSE